MSMPRDPKSSDDVRMLQSRLRSSARDEELLRSLRAVLGPDVPAANHRLEERDARFRIVKVEPKWRRVRNTKASAIADPDATTPRPAPRASTGAWPSLKQPQRGKPAGVHQAAQSSGASHGVQSVPAVQPKTTEKPRLESREKLGSIPAVRGPAEVARTTELAPTSDTATARNSVARQESLEPNAEEAVVPESAKRARTSTSIAAGQDVADDRAASPPSTSGKPSDTRAMQAPPNKQDEWKPVPPSDALPGGATQNSKDGVQLPGQIQGKRTISLRSNLSVSRQHVEGTSRRVRSHAAAGAGILPATEAGTSSSADPIPAPRKLTSVVSPGVVCGSQSHAAGLVLESSRYSIRDLGAGQASSKYSSGSGTVSTAALVKTMEAGSQTSLPVATRESLEPLAGLRTALSDATASTQHAFQTALEGTDDLQRFGGKAAMSWRQTPDMCFSPCLLGSGINNAESSERLLPRDAAVPVEETAGDSLLVTASLASLSRSSRDEGWPRRLPSASRPTLETSAAVPKKTSSRFKRVGSGKTWHNIDSEETPLAPIAGSTCTGRDHFPGNVDASRGAANKAGRSSEVFHSTGSTQLPPSEKVTERSSSVDQVGVSTLRKPVQDCSSSEKAGGPLSSSAVAASDVAAQGARQPNGASLDDGVPSLTNKQRVSSHSERTTGPSLSVKSTNRGRKTSSLSSVTAAAPSCETPLRNDRRGTADQGGKARSFSLDVRAGNVLGEAGTSSAQPVSVSNRAEASTDSTFYTASEMRRADGNRPSAVKGTRERSACKAAKKTSFLRPATETAGVNSAEMNLLAGTKTPSSEEFCTAPKIIKKQDPELDAWSIRMGRNASSLYDRAPDEVGRRDSTERLDGSDEGTSPAVIRENVSEFDGLPRMQDRAEPFCGAFNKHSSEELLSEDSERGYALFARAPLRRIVSPDRNLPRLDDRTSGARNLLADFLTAGRRSRASSEFIRSPWRTGSLLVLAHSPASLEDEDLGHALVIPTAARGYLDGKERVTLRGTPDIIAAPDTSTTSGPSFLTARSLSEPVFVALRPPAMRDSRSLSSSLFANPGSVVLGSGEPPKAYCPPTDLLRKTAEEKRLPKVAPKKKRPRQTVTLKPTVAQTDMTLPQGVGEGTHVPTAQSPGVTGMEVSMTTRSHAKELCLAMLAVSICVLGLVLLARSASAGRLGDMRVFTSESNTSEDSRRAGNDPASARTTAAFTVVPSFLVCNLSRCVEDGGYIASSLSWDRDPCVDFYDFACAKWLEERAASASVMGGVSASVAEDAERDMEQRVAHLLSSTRSPEFAPLRHLHDACTDVNFINAAGWAPLGELLRLCGLPYWPYDEVSTLSPWKAAARALQYTGAEAFVSVDVTSHPVRANRSISALDRPRLVLRPADLDERDVHWLEDTADTIMTVFRERPRHLARECVAVAVQIARLTYSRDALSDVRLYRVVHLGPFPQLLEFLATLFANVSSVHASSEVLLRAEGFLRDLLDLADEHRSRALLNYIGLRVAVHSSAFLPDAAGLQAVHGRVLFAHEPTGGYVPRDRLCVRQAATTMPFLFMYAVRLLLGGEATVRAMNAALDTMRHHLAEHLSKLSLADYQTRLQLVNVVRDTRLHLMGPPLVANASHVLAHAHALPSTGDDVPLLWFAHVTAHVTQLRLMRLSRFVWRGGAFDRDCSSDLQANAVFVPPLFLNASDTLDRSLLALQAPHMGARFVRCLLMMLLAGVSNRGNRELVTRGWWSDSAKSALDALRRCLARPVPGAGDDSGAAVNDKAPLSRVADTLAVAPALSAFTHGLQVLAGSARHFRLPLVEGLSTAQLFFGYYALSRCHRERRRRGSRRDAASTDDVNAAVRQNAAFHEAFECARGRPMNADSPCALWA